MNSRTLSGGKNPAGSRITQLNEKMYFFNQTPPKSASSMSNFRRFAHPDQNRFWYHELVAVL